MANSIKVLNSALDESPLRGGTIILRGVLDVDSLKHLKIGDYQREVMPLSPRHPLMKAMKAGEPFPDVELGVRGESYYENDSGFHIRDDTYIIDGLQRISAAIRFNSLFAGLPQPRIGSTIHFNTTREWERDRFDTLNTKSIRVSPGILLRNQKDKSPAMELLYDMSEEDTRFVLHKRVSWKQNMARSDLIGAMMLCRVVTSLHGHSGVPVRATTSNLMVQYLDQLVEVVGSQNIRMNLRLFFEVIDECWGIRQIQYKDHASQLKGTFLVVLAKIFSKHTDFWQMSARKLVVGVDHRRKLSQFPLSDPTVMNLAASGGKAHHVLFDMIRDHMDKGKVKHRLTLRVQE
jgi:ribosomal protein L35AE/L33A